MVADLRRRPPRKVRLGGLELLLGVPLMVFAAVALVGGTFYLLVYAISGPSVPGLINQGDAEGPAPVKERLQAAAYGVPFLAILAYLTWRAARARLSTPKVAIDSRGVWLLIGGRIAQGLEWAQIAAVNLVGPGGATTIPATAAAPPLVEVFPVERIRDRNSPLPHSTTWRRPSTTSPHTAASPSSFSRPGRAGRPPGSLILRIRLSSRTARGTQSSAMMTSANPPSGKAIGAPGQNPDRRVAAEECRGVGQVTRKGATGRSAQLFR